MKNTTFAITIPHLFLLSSALGVAINPYIITPSFNINETVPKNQSNILIPLFKINKEYRSAIAYHDKVIEGGCQIANEIIEYLKWWLVNHIQVTDKKYIDCFKKNGLK